MLIANLATTTIISQSKNFDERKEKVITILKNSIEKGLPGSAIAYFSAQNGHWEHAEGFSNLEKQVPLNNTHLHYLQSVSKTYMAVAILQLMEQGKIHLEDDIAHHLDKTTLGGLASKGITVKMLLNHTSGIPEYATEPALVSFFLENPLAHSGVQKFIDVVKNKPLNFEPATDWEYSNTNYTLLSMIADKITGDHISFIHKNIMKPLGLRDTYYLTKKNYDKIPNITNSYWDVLNIEKPVNVTSIQKVNVSNLRGDDGLICTTKDAVKFMKGLVEGKLLKESSLKLMQEWIIKDGKRKYGLGIFFFDLGVTYAIGHSGGGLGAGCVLMYLPELDSHVFITTNFNTLIESKIGEKAAGIRQQILEALFL